MGTLRGRIKRSASQYEKDATTAQHNTSVAAGALGRGGTYWHEELNEKEEEGWKYGKR